MGIFPKIEINAFQARKRVPGLLAILLQRLAIDEEDVSSAQARPRPFSRTRSGLTVAPEWQFQARKRVPGLLATTKLAGSFPSLPVSSAQARPRPFSPARGPALVRQMLGFKRASASPAF